MTPRLIMEVAVTPIGLGQLRPRSWWQFALLGYAAVAMVLVIVVLEGENALSERVLEALPPLLAAIGITTFVGDLRAGVAATIIVAAAVDYYFVPPLHTLGWASKDVPSLLVFGLSALFFVWVIGALRHSLQALEEARNEMEGQVRKRTAQLSLANERLQAEVRERQQAEEALEDLAGRLIHAQEQERSRIGRELHDHVSQRLGLLSIKIDQLRMDRSRVPEMSDALDDLRRHTGEITDDIHGLSHRLHSSILDQLGIVPALQRLVKECSERYAIPIAFACNVPSVRLPSDIALCVFRVAEECVTNIAKHSRCRSARIEIAVAPDGIGLTVADDGVGLDPAVSGPAAGLGFVSMRERLRLVRGTMNVHSVPAQGTTVEVWVPSSRLES